MRTYRMLALLLAYPDREIIDAGPQILSVLRREALLSPGTLIALETFVAGRGHADLLTVQEEYVATFDRGRAHCLHLFEHIHGESRDRGQAMVDLAETYAAKGLEIAAGEMPDYLPLFLEFLSECAPDEASALLGEALVVIALIGRRLRDRQSPYGVVFAAIEGLAGRAPDDARLDALQNEAKADPTTPDELDAEWREAEAFAEGPSDSACAACITPVSSDIGRPRAQGGPQ